MSGEGAGWTVVSTAATGEQALLEALRTQPDVVLLDLRLPDMRGDEVCRRLRWSWPDLIIVMLTCFDNDGAFRCAMNAGANAYVTKAAGFSALVKTLDDVFAEPDARRDFRPDVEPRTPDPLTSQDRHLLELAARGLSDRAIGQTVHLAESTIRFHMQ